MYRKSPNCSFHCIQTTPQACKEAAITVRTLYRWQKDYGGLKMDQAKRLKELEKEVEAVRGGAVAHGSWRYVMRFEFRGGYRQSSCGLPVTATYPVQSRST
jgi:hypothetical protein